MWHAIHGMYAYENDREQLTYEFVQLKQDAYCMDATQIQQSIEQQMPDARVQVHSPDGVHFTAEIESAAFAGLTRIAQHRMVHDIIGPALGAEIHALSLQTRVPPDAAADPA